VDGDLAGRPIARWWHVATAAIVAAALLLELALALTTGPDAFGTRLVRFASYFTVESEVLVLISVALLVRDPIRSGGVWRVIRLDGVVAAAATTAVYTVALRQTVQLDGWANIGNIGLHYVAPVISLLGWVVFGPRLRADGRTVIAGALWPLLWSGWILALGAATGWYPYPFIDVRAIGYPRALANAGVVTLLLLALFALAAWADRRLAAWERRRIEAQPGWGPYDAAA
jgi:hypothetical protein